MKASNYNFFIEHDDDSYLAYNSRSNSLAIIEKENFRKYSDFVLTGKEIDDSNLVEKLKEGYFLIDDDVDELKILRFQMYKDRMSEHTLSLTIAPTSDCNFRCVYCYEKKSIRKKSMTLEVEDAIIDLIKSVKTTISSMNVAWYGGEPLLRFDVIERLSKRIIQICKENNIQYFSSIVTNGYLLTPEIAKKLAEYQIKNIQVTLDGPKETHDKRRILANGEGSFEKIINNIAMCKEFLPKINLRINVDKSNFDKVQELYEYFKERNILDIVVPYLGQVKSSNDCYQENKCLSNNTFSKLLYQFQSFTNRTMFAFYPIRRTNLCGADSLYSFVIDSDGMLYKCWDDIGIECKSVGNLLEGKTMNMKNVDYITKDPTLLSKCKECKFLPICMGGCPFHFGESENCTYFKYHLELYLKKVAQERLFEMNYKKDC